MGRISSSYSWFKIMSCAMFVYLFFSMFLQDLPELPSCYPTHGVGQEGLLLCISCPKGPPPPVRVLNRSCFIKTWHQWDRRIDGSKGMNMIVILFCLELFELLYLEFRTSKSLLTLSMKSAVSLASGGSLFRLTMAEIPVTEEATKVSWVSEMESELNVKWRCLKTIPAETEWLKICVA